VSKRVGLSGVDPAHVDRVVRETLRRLTARLNADLAERGSRWRVPTEVDLSALERALRDFVPPERRWKLYPPARRALRSLAAASGHTLTEVKRWVAQAAEYEAVLASFDAPDAAEREVSRRMLRLADLYAGTDETSQPSRAPATELPAGEVPAADLDHLDEIIAAAEDEARQARTTARLSPRERQLVDLLLAGRTLAEAGQQMGIARATVDTMAHRLKRKAARGPL